MTASTEQIRSHFPALERRVGDTPVAYFDGPGGTQVARPVVTAMEDYLFHHNANTHWAYPTSEETDDALANARRACAAMLNGRPEDIVFGANMTTLTYHVSRAVGRSLSSGDEIVVTELDHHANIDPWRALEVERGVVVRIVRMIPETGQLDLDHLRNLVGPRTRLVAIGAASNALGTVNDVRAAVEAARDVGALSFVDGVHYAPHTLPDVEAIGCDFFACSAYKFYGPHVGVLYVRADVSEVVDFPRLAPAPSRPPERPETGTLNHEGIVGTAAVVEWLGSLSASGSLRESLESTYVGLHDRGEQLIARMWNGLSNLPGIRLFGPEPGKPRTPTLAFAVDGLPSEEVTRRLASEAVFVTHGDFYAQTVVRRLGYERDGLVRAGCACYTSEEEVDRLVEGVSRIVSR